MPRNVRNFWIELDVDGRKSRVATGPRRKDGGFEMTIYIRDLGEVASGLRVVGTALGNSLSLSAWNAKGEEISVEAARN